MRYKPQEMQKIINMSDEEIFARTLFGEARGECVYMLTDRDGIDLTDDRFAGLVAVGQVILNRVRLQNWYGKTIRDVCLKPYQFSCWNGQDINFIRMLAVGDGDIAYNVCKQIANGLINQQVSDRVLGADHYHVVKLQPPPYWVKHATPTVTVGNHRFYRMKRGLD